MQNLISGALTKRDRLKGEYNIGEKRVRSEWTNEVREKGNKSLGVRPECHKVEGPKGIEKWGFGGENESETRVAIVRRII